MNRRNFTRHIALGCATGLLTMTDLNSFANTNKAFFCKKIIKPNRLKINDTIGLITPASPISKSAFEKTVSNLKGLGFKLKYGKHIKLKNGYLAGTDQERLEDIHYMFEDDSIKGIWCTRGGYGTARLLPYLDYKLIKRNPKALIGYSDITALLQAIYVKTGLVGFHGPVGSSTFSDYAIEHIKAVLMNPKKEHVIRLSEENAKRTEKAYHAYSIREGKAKGRLIGGNLTLLAAAAGTPFNWDVKDKILFIEDIGEKPYRIDRMLTQIRQNSPLKKAAGIALGVFEDCETKAGSLSLSLAETLKDRLYDLGIPVIYGLSFGHIKNQCTLPIGIEAELDTQNQTITLLEDCVK